LRSDDRAVLEDGIRRHLAGGDLRAAAAAAVKGYGPPILSYLMAVLQDAAAADEVFAQFCENLWKSIGLFRGESAFRTWAYRLAWCAAQDFGRDPYRARGRRLSTTEAAELAESVRSTVPSHLRTPMRDELAALKASLDSADRSLLVLRFENGLSWKEVAVVMSQEEGPVAEAAVRKRFQRLRTRMRELRSRRS